ncbi:hypothetical protein G9A89_010738 [Geosiphon pyriformis]|nr:hypothetical protein G9A89_010738 [Geosiphon pyriformis]
MPNLKKLFRKLFKRKSGKGRKGRNVHNRGKKNQMPSNKRSTGAGTTASATMEPTTNPSSAISSPTRLGHSPSASTGSTVGAGKIPASISPHSTTGNKSEHSSRTNSPTKTQFLSPYESNQRDEESATFDPFANTEHDPTLPRRRERSDTGSTSIQRNSSWPIPSRPVSGRRDWRSGYQPIDTLVSDIRIQYPEPDQHMSWIPFDEFVGHRFVARGGSSAIYQATWLKTGQRIALKCLDDSADISTEFLNQLKRHWGVYTQSESIRIHGITQLPESGDFMIVMQYAVYGNLPIHIQRNRLLSWKDKCEIVASIARSLTEIHKRGLVHGDIHSGNILNLDGASSFVITDTGICGPANRKARRDVPHGVLPYVAPEVLAGNECTQKSDVFSFAMIMWELSAGLKPYLGRAHDYYLAKEIYEGTRPSVQSGTPSFYEELMIKCWESNPRNRPDAQEILRNVNKWFDNDQFDDIKKNNVTRSFNNASNDRIHPEAIYHSRPLEFPNLKVHGRKPVASTIVPRKNLLNEPSPVAEKESFENGDRKSNYLPNDLIDEVLKQKTEIGQVNLSELQVARLRDAPLAVRKQMISLYITDDEISTVTAFWASEPMPEPFVVSSV